MNHPWRTYPNSAQLAVLKKEAARRKRKQRYDSDTKDPIYRAAMTETHVDWEKRKYHSDPDFKAKRQEYYRLRAQSKRKQEAA